MPIRNHRSHTREMKSRQLEASLRKLQEEDNNDMNPIWNYQSKLRMSTMNNQVAIKKKDGTECQRMEETLE